jgi:hypothetical protein
MKIVVTSVLVDDQDKALRFYTEMLGFRPKEDVPLGEHRWLTVVSPLDPNGVELVLEPDAHPAAKPFKRHCWPMAFLLRPSVSMTSRRSTNGSSVLGYALRSRPSRWGQLPRPSSTIRRQSPPDRTAALMRRVSGG